MTRPRRLLISYFFGDTAIPLGAAVADACAAAGVEVLRFDSQREPWTHRWIARHAAGGLSRLLRRDVEASIPGSSAWTRDRELDAACAAFRPEALLVIHGSAFSPGVVRARARRHGVRRTLGWWVKDVRCSPREAALAREYDAFATIGDWNGRFPRIDAFAADRARWHPPGMAVEQDIPVLFVGGWNRRRYAFFRALEGLPVHCYGPHWSRRGFAPFHKGDGLWGDALLRTMHRAQLVLNVSSFDGDAGGGANLRILDVPLTGACLVGERCAAMERIYGASCVDTCFSTPQELAGRVRSLLADGPRRSAVAAAMHAAAAVQPGYGGVAGLLLDLLDLDDCQRSPAADPARP